MRAVASPLLKADKRRGPVVQRVGTVGDAAKKESSFGLSPTTDKHKIKKI
jgi:hypothetical protein